MSDDPFAMGVRAAIEVGGEIQRCGIYGHDAGMLGTMLTRARSGNYLEIGSGFGGSVLTAKKVKAWLAIPGEFYCVDNYLLDPGRQFHGATREDFLNNTHADRAGSNIHLFGSVAEMLRERPGVQFSCALIDGYHKGDEPLLDFLSIKSLVVGAERGRIYFHDRSHSDIFSAIGYALADPCWAFDEAGGSSFVIKRIIDEVAE